MPSLDAKTRCGECSRELRLNSNGFRPLEVLEVQHRPAERLQAPLENARQYKSVTPVVRVSAAAISQQPADQDSDATVLLCPHEWGSHKHPSLMSPDHAQPGNGLLLFFRVDDFELTLQRARARVPTLDEEPHVHPSTETKEFSLRDPDGYYVTISALA